jgi:hypothetical protein
MEYKKIHEHDELFAKELFKTFSTDQSGNPDLVTLEELYDKLRQWYKNLNEINKVKSIYENGKLDKFIEIFGKLERTNVRSFILEEIKTIYGYDRQDLIHKGLSKNKLTNFS